MPRATITAEGLRALSAMAAEGQDQYSIAAALGMNRSTLQALIKRDEQAEEAMNLGKALLADELSHLLLRAARRVKCHGRPPIDHRNAVNKQR